MRLDRLYDIEWRVVRHVAFGWLDSLANQVRTPADWVAASAVVFLAVCERFNLNPARVLEAAERIRRRARQGFGSAEVRAIDAYLREELPDV